MHQALNHTHSLESEILFFGEDVLKRISSGKPSPLTLRFWSNRLMKWSMAHPDLKANLFRLVDVLPVLKSNQAISDHLVQYLEAHKALIPWYARLAMRLPDFVLGPIVRVGVHAMAMQFIAGSSPKRARFKLRRLRKNHLAFTVDLLGEFTVSEEESEEYFSRYMYAIEALSAYVPSWRETEPIIPGHPGETTPVSVSVKLSALYSQCSSLNATLSIEQLSSRLALLASRATKLNASIYVDAEDSGTNPIIYEVFKRVFGSAEFCNVRYPGIVVQAYAKESSALVEDLLRFSKKRGAPIAIRLVKGAYWDSETINARQQGWESPLFTDKESSDANYEHLSRKLLDNHDLVLPAFGSHNIRSLSHACCYAKSLGLTSSQFELQMLYGMAEPIAKAFRDLGYLVRMYVPLGNLLVGMGYLVRRLLENTSNDSFLRHTFLDQSEQSQLLRKPQMKG